MVVRALLHENVLAPSPLLPIAACVGVRWKHSMAFVQVLRKHLDSRLADDLKVLEEAVLHVLAIF